MWPGITRFSLVCLRFDDYHQNADPETWVEVLSAYNERGIHGVVAVPPVYEGEKLSAEVVDFLHELVEDGWEVAQHGHRHEDVGKGRGGPLYDDRSEFAGLPFEEQTRKVGAGKEILQSHGFDPTTFVPPWHEYDRNTVRALAEEGFDCLNEGRWPVPRSVDGVTLVPTHVPAVTPYILGAGVLTLVRHPHIDTDPMKDARAVAGYENRVRTPSEVADWWQNSSTLGSIVDQAEPVFGSLGFAFRLFYESGVP
jgi:peptidoglycan/xylan/chitin deacetylase (PgdA/CDA1 family)